MDAVRWKFCLEEPLVHFVTLFLANEYFTLLSRWIESIVLSQSMLPVTQVALMPLVPFLIISSLYLANIFALLYILPTIACFIVYEGWIHHVNNTMEAIFFSYTQSSTALSVQKQDHFQCLQRTGRIRNRSSLKLDLIFSVLEFVPLTVLEFVRFPGFRVNERPNRTNWWMDPNSSGPV